MADGDAGAASALCDGLRLHGYEAFPVHTGADALEASRGRSVDLLLLDIMMGRGAEGVMMAFEPSPKLVINGLGVSLLSGLLAGTIPAWQAAGTEIVPALRQT